MEKQNGAHVIWLLQNLWFGELAISKMLEKKKCSELEKNWSTGGNFTLIGSTYNRKLYTFKTFT